MNFNQDNKIDIPSPMLLSKHSEKNYIYNVEDPLVQLALPMEIKGLYNHKNGTTLQCGAYAHKIKSIKRKISRK